MSDGSVVVTFATSPEMREAMHEPLATLATITYLDDLRDDERANALASTNVVLALSIGRELRGEQELALLDSVCLVQLLSAGVDHFPFDRIPEGVTVASNAGAYADPMAEHVLAMALALAKRLPQNHAALARGEFDQDIPNRAIRGALVGVLGFGGIGQASARLFRAMGAGIHALTRSGCTAEPIEKIGTLRDLDAILTAADILLISLPLTRTTRGLIGSRELSLMKPDAILVNVARAAIVDEDALYEHLRITPTFSAGLDTWWQEPRGNDRFSTRRPFLELANVLGSPHNSGITSDSLVVAARHAAENVARWIRGQQVQHLVDRGEYLERRE